MRRSRRLAARARSAKGAAKGAAASADARQAAQEAAHALRDLSRALTDQVRSAGVDDRVHELATRARQKMHEAGLDERAAEMAARVRQSEMAQAATQRARGVSDETLDRVGTWLASGPRAEKLGLHKGRGRLPTWLAVLLGAAAGYITAMLLGTRREDSSMHDLTDSIVTPMADGPSLADRVRERLEHDPRTAALAGLSVDVADHTVLISGNLEGDVDEDQIRAVVTSVPGVTGVDVRLETTSA